MSACGEGTGDVGKLYAFLVRVAMIPWVMDLPVYQAFPVIEVWTVRDFTMSQPEYVPIRIWLKLWCRPSFVDR